MLTRLLDAIMPGQEIVSFLFSDFFIWLILLLVANMLVAAAIVITIVLVRKKKASKNIKVIEE